MSRNPVRRVQRGGCSRFVGPKPSVSVKYNVPSDLPSVSYLETDIKEINVKPSDKVIREPGEHLISEGSAGNSKLFFYPHFMSTHDADQAFSLLMEAVPWKQREDNKYGLQPRLTAWYGEHPYAYSGLHHDARQHWPDILTDIKGRVETVTSHTFNSVLCNLYRDNKDSVDWHSDNEPALHRNPYIASVSLGDVRLFELRKKCEDEDYSNSQHVRIHLPHGSLLVMEGAVQEDWQHRLPKHYHDRPPRINLTFRMIYDK